MTSYQVILFVIWIALIAIHLVVTRSRYFNAPKKVLHREGDTLVMRAKFISMLFTKWEKRLNCSDVIKIQRSKNMVTLFTQSGNAYDIWLVERWAEPLFSYAKYLLPDAKAIVIDENGRAISQGTSGT